MGRVTFAQLNALTAKQLAAICKRYDKYFVNPPDCPSNKAKMVRILAGFFNSPKHQNLPLPKELKTARPRRKISPDEAKAAWINYWNSDRAKKRYPNPQDLEYAAVYDLKTHLTPQKRIDDDRYLGPYGPDIYDYPGIDWGQQSFTDPREITIWSIMTARIPELRQLCQEYKKYIPTLACTQLKNIIQGSFLDLFGITAPGKGRILARWLNTNINVYDRSLLLAKVSQSVDLPVEKLESLSMASVFVFPEVPTTSFQEGVKIEEVPGSAPTVPAPEPRIRPASFQQPFEPDERPTSFQEGVQMEEVPGSLPPEAGSVPYQPPIWWTRPETKAASMPEAQRIVSSPFNAPGWERKARTEPTTPASGYEDIPLIQEVPAPSLEGGSVQYQRPIWWTRPETKASSLPERRRIESAPSNAPRSERKTMTESITTPESEYQPPPLIEEDEEFFSPLVAFPFLENMVAEQESEKDFFSPYGEESDEDERPGYGRAQQ